MEIKRGDVIDIDFDPARGHEIRKTRLAVVVQNDIGNPFVFHGSGFQPRSNYGIIGKGDFKAV